MAVTGEVPLPRFPGTISAPGGRALPIDRLMTAYNLFLAALWMGAGGARPVMWFAATLHLTAAALPVLLPRRSGPRSRTAALVRDLYPLAVLPAFWVEIDVLFPLRHSGTFDAYIHGLEQALFGTQLGETWMPSAPHPWLSEIMHFSYFAYYGAIYLPPLLMAAAGRTEETRDMVFRLMAAYLTCYVVYLLFPVDGPHFRHEHYQGDLTGGFFYELVAATQGAGDSRGCSFPSSHVAGAVTAAYLGWRWLSRPVAWLLGIEALGVVLSTVYTQNHYAVDSVAGATWAMALQLLILPPLLRRAGVPERRRMSAARPAAATPIPVLWTGHRKRRRQWAT